MSRAGEIKEKLQNSITAENILLTALRTPGVKISRSSFLRKELNTFLSEEDVNRAIRHNPAAVGIPREKMDDLAQKVINLETSKVTGASILASLPAAALPAAVVGAVTADIVTYFAHIMRVLQMLAYLYGFDEFKLDDEDTDPETMNNIMIFLGVMFGIRGSGPALSKLADATAKHVTKKLVKRRLRKNIVIPEMKKIVAKIGIKLTKQMIMDAVASAIPVAGSVASGVLMYALFKPRCMKLKRKLMTYPLCDPVYYKTGE